MMTDRDTKETKGSFKYIILSGSDGYPPIQKTPGSAGFDVKAPAQVTIPPGGGVLKYPLDSVSTPLTAPIPELRYEVVSP